jgi:hypothetical protein
MAIKIGEEEPMTEKGCLPYYKTGNVGPVNHKSGYNPNNIGRAVSSLKGVCEKKLHYIITS